MQELPGKTCLCKVNPSASQGEARLRGRDIAHAG